MKKGFQLVILFWVCVLLWGCPYSSPYGIDAVAIQQIDDNLLGSWSCSINKPAAEGNLKTDSIKISFAKYTDKEYAIVLTGEIKDLKPFHCLHNDSITGTAYLSYIGEKQFLNTFINGQMYIAELIKSPGGLSIFCLAERFTARYIKSSDQLKNSIAYHYKVAINPAYDDYFVLKNLQKTE